MGPHRPRLDHPALRPELRRLDHRHPAADLGGVVWRHLARERFADHQLRTAVGRRLGRARPAADHDAGQVQSCRRRVSVPRHRPAGRGPALSEQLARHRQRRAPCRLCLEHRRQRQLGHSRRQRPVLQHSRFEHDVQHSVVQWRAHSRELVPERRPSGVPAGSDPRCHAGRYRVRQGAAAGARTARDRARLPDAVDVAEHHWLPGPVGTAVGH